MIPVLEIMSGNMSAAAFDARIVRRFGLLGERLVLSREGDDEAEIELDPLFFRDLAIRTGSSDAVAAARRFLGGDAVPVAGAVDGNAMLLAADSLRCFLDSELPVEMERARRLAKAEIEDPGLSRLSPVERAEDFEARWSADAFASRIDLALSRAPDRVRIDPKLRETVAFWVRRDDLGGLQGRGIAAARLVDAVVQPEYRRGGGFEPTGRVLAGAAGVSHLEAGFGDVEKRRLHFDVAALKAMGRDLPSSARDLLAARVESLALSEPPEGEQRKVALETSMAGPAMRGSGR